MFGLFDNSGRDIKAQLGETRNLYNSIVAPELRDVDFRPEMMDYQTIQEDPLILQSQLAALDKMQRLADEGLSAEDKLAFFKANQMAGDRAGRASGAIQQNALARGVSGGGMEFALREQANQEEARRAQEQGMAQAAATARQRAMQQMAAADQMGSIRNQDYRQKADNTNVINQFNSMNTGMRNQANLRNIDQRRTNEQQRFGNEMMRADGIAGANRDMANAQAAQGAADAQNLNSAIQAGIGTYMLASDINLKKEIRNAGHAIDETLENLSPYIWLYENPKFGEGEYVGVMAQDFEKTKAGREIVLNTPEGKMLDNHKLLSFLVGTVAHQAKKIKELEARIV